jgi:hypothetical protein
MRSSHNHSLAKKEQTPQTLPEKVRHAIGYGDDRRGACSPREIDSINSIRDDTAERCGKMSNARWTQGQSG